MAEKKAKDELGLGRDLSSGAAAFEPEDAEERRFESSIQLRDQEDTAQPASRPRLELVPLGELVHSSEARSGEDDLPGEDELEAWVEDDFGDPVRDVSEARDEDLEDTLDALTPVSAVPAVAGLPAEPVAGVPAASAGASVGAEGSMSRSAVGATMVEKFPPLETSRALAFPSVGESSWSASSSETRNARPWLGIILGVIVVIAAGYAVQNAWLGSTSPEIPRSPQLSAQPPYAALAGEGEAAAVATEAADVAGPVTADITSPAPAVLETESPAKEPRVRTAGSEAKVRGAESRVAAAVGVDRLAATPVAAVPVNAVPVDAVPTPQARSVSGAVVEGVPEVPSRDAVRVSLEAMRPALGACTGGKDGLALAELAILGSGRVVHAVVKGDFGGTPEGSCMAKALRGATVPAFSRARFEVSYPFVLP